MRGMSLMLILEAPDSYATSPNKEGTEITTTNNTSIQQQARLNYRIKHPRLRVQVSDWKLHRNFQNFNDLYHIVVIHQINRVFLSIRKLLMISYGAHMLHL